MSKRQEIRQRRQRARLRNRIIVIFLVAAGVLLVTFALIETSLKGSQGNGIVKVTPVAYTAAANWTSLGDPNAPVKVDVWEDFQCPTCRSYSENLEPQVVRAFVETGQAYYTFHSYPFVSEGQGESQQAANASLCAAAQDSFWAYHDTLFANWLGENVGSYTDARLVTFARNIGLDMTAFNQCFEANTYSDRIAQDIQAGVQLGISSTPTIFVNSQRVVSSAGELYLPSFEEISAAIEAALQGQ